MLKSRYLICHPVANLFAQPDNQSAVVSQAIYSWIVTVLDESSSFKFVETYDGYKGWVDHSALTEYSERKNLLKITSLMSHIYYEPDLTKRKPLITLPFESELEIISEPETEGSRWIEVKLLNGFRGWIQRGDVSKQPIEPIKNLVDFSKNFLGLPYTWGGVSSFGYDCSGFIQMLFRQQSILLPRDARDQVNSEVLIPIQKNDLNPEALVFYGPYEGKITHVSMYIGHQQIIHASTRPRPVLQIAALDDQALHQTHPFRLYRHVKK